MNHFEINWPDGASDGKPTTAAHDTYFANAMFD